MRSGAPPTFVARLTPPIASAIATIAVSGPLAVEAICDLVHGNAFDHDWLQPGRIRYGLWNAHANESGAEQVVVCRTGPETVEVHCHGGNAICELIVADLQQRGCVRCPSSEFPSEETDPIRRDAEQAIQSATTDRAAAVLLDQANGALSLAVQKATELARSGQTEAAKRIVDDALGWQELGLHLTNPWRVVLAGPPNVGKSSLVNAIVGTERMIVHHEPGTTRDWVEVLTAIDGWPVSFTDTAGYRDSKDEIEGEGIRRAVERVRVADLVILVVDATVGWTEVHAELQRVAAGKPTLIAWNKIDMESKVDRPSTAIPTSVNQPEGVHGLMAAIGQSLVPVAPAPGTAVPFMPHHIERLRKILG
jgi:tRNA modification GTPase